MRDTFDTIEYGSLHLQVQGTPHPIVEIIPQMTRLFGNEDIARSFGDYKRCNKVATLGRDPSVQVSIGNITSEQDLLDILNPLTPNSGGLCDDNWTIRFWDVIDPTIPTLKKIHGINAAYSRIQRGRKKGNRGTYEYNNTVNPDARFPRPLYEAFLTRLWNGVWNGVAFPNPPSPWDPNFYQCFWLTRNWQTQYRLVPIQSLSMVNLNPNRFVLDHNTNIPFQVSSSNYVAGVIDRNVAVPYVVALDSNGNIVLEDNAKILAEKGVYQVGSDKSAVIAYPLEEIGTGFRSVLLKPVGIDSIYTNYFDNTRYEINTVTLNADREAYPLLQRLSNSDAQSGFNEEVDQAGPWVNAVWTRKCRLFRKIYMGNKHAANIRFMLRDLVTNRVSIYSRGEIRFGATSKGMPSCFQVHTNTQY